MLQPIPDEGDRVIPTFVHWNSVDSQLGQQVDIKDGKIVFPMANASGPHRKPIISFADAHVVANSTLLFIRKVRKTDGRPEVPEQWMRCLEIFRTAYCSNASIDEPCAICNVLQEEKEGSVLKCEICLLSYHPDCLQSALPNPGEYISAEPMPVPSVLSSHIDNSYKVCALCKEWLATK